MYLLLQIVGAITYIVWSLWSQNTFYSSMTIKGINSQNILFWHSLHCDSLKFAIINMPVAFQASTNHSKVDMQLTKFLPSLISEYDPMTDPPPKKTWMVVIPLSLELKMIWLLRSKHPQQPVVAVSHVTQAMENVQRRNLEEPYFKKR